MTASPSDAELCALIRDGDREAAATIQTRHEGLVAHVLKKHRFPFLAETLQAGRIGLHLAAQRFNPKLGRFSDHAARQIKNEIIRHLTHKGAPGGMKINTGRAGKKAWPKQVGLNELRPISADRTSGTLNTLSPLPRVVCLLLSQGIDPVKRLGLYRGELDRIRRRAFEEVA